MKSQISNEFLVGVIFILIIYVASLTGFNSFAKTQMLQSESAREVCYTISSAISSAYVGGDGFSTNVTMPYSLDSEFNFFVIAMNKSNIDVNWPGGLVSCSIITQNITTGLMYAGKFSINNINSTIYISSITTDKLLYGSGETVTINGSYFLNNVSLALYVNDVIVLGYPVEVLNVNNTFSYATMLLTQEHYKVEVNDINMSTFYAEREFDVI